MTLSPQTAQGARQASVRAVTGTALDYNGDWMALFDKAGIPAGPFDQRMLAWINLNLSSAYTNIESAMQALAAANAAYNFSSMGTFNAGSAPPATVSLNGVTFTLEYSLKYPAGALSDSATGIMSVWLRLYTGDSNHNVPPGGYTSLGRYIVGNITNVGSAEDQPGFNWTMDNSAPPTTAGGVWRLNLLASGSTGASPSGALGVISPGNPNNALWAHYLVAWDTGFGVHAKKGSVYRNGVYVGGVLNEAGSVGSMLVALSKFDFEINGTIAGFQSAGIFDMAQLWFDCPSDMSTILIPDGASPPNCSIPDAIVKKFYNGGPVDLGIAATPKGSLPFGNRPLIYHDGPKATWPANLGTLASPLPVGSATYTAVPYQATTGPNNLPAGPYLDWFAPDGTIGLVESAGTFSAFTTFGNPIALNSRIFVWVSVNPNDNFDHAFTTASSGWSVVDTGYANSAGRPVNTLLITKIADAGDVTLPGGVWATPPTVTWTPNGVNTFFETCYCVFTTSKADGSAPSIIAHDKSVQLNTSYTAPTVTGTAANQLLFNVFHIYSWDDPAGAEFGPPTDTGTEIGFKGGGLNSSNCLPFITWQRLTASGATGARSLQHSSGTVRSNIGHSVILG